MESRYSCFVKTGICSARLIETGASVESFLITTAAGTLSILTPDSSSSYRSKPLEFDPQRVVDAIPALKPSNALLDLAFSASVSGVMSADPSEDCLYTVNDTVSDVSHVSAISMCRLTTAERSLVSICREKKCHVTRVVPPLVLLAQQCNVSAYMIPFTANLTQNQTEAFWVPTGDVVVHIATFLPLASKLRIDSNEAEEGKVEVDYFVVSRDRYGRYFRGEELLAERRLPDHVLRVKTLGRFILLVLADHSLCMFYLNDTSILQLYRFPSDQSLVDACLLEKPPSNILLEKRPLSTSASFKALEAKTVEEGLNLDPSAPSANKNASGPTVEGIPLIVKLFSNRVSFSVLTFHPTTVDRSMPSITELPIYYKSIALPFAKSTLPTELLRCTIDSGTLSALPNKSLLWILANDTFLTFSVRTFDDAYSMLSAYNFRGYICNSKHDLSHVNEMYDVMHLLAKKRTLLAQMQVLRQRQVDDSDTNVDAEENTDGTSKEYKFGDLLREARLLGICCADMKARSKLASLSCFPGHYLVKIVLPEPVFVHSIAILDPKTGSVRSVFAPLSFKDAFSEFRRVCCGSEDSSTASSLGPVTRDNNVHTSLQFLSMEHRIRHALISYKNSQIIDVVNDMTVLDNEEARRIFLSELTRTYLSEKCTALLPALHHVSHHPNKNSRPESIVELPISSDIVEKYAGSTLILQLSVTQTNPGSASHGISIPIPLTLPACPMIRFCSSAFCSALSSFEGTPLTTIIEEVASLTMNFTNHKVLSAKLGDILRSGALVALSDDYDELVGDIERLNEVAFFVENCNTTTLLNLLTEVSDGDLSCSKLLGYSAENSSLDLLAKTQLSTVFKVHFSFESLQLTKVQLSGLDIPLLVSFAQKLASVLLPDGSDTRLLRALCSSFGLSRRVRSFLTAVKNLHQSSQDQLEHVSAGLSELSSRMLLDCDQTLDLTSMCFYRRAVDQLQNLRNSVRITVKQALDAQESNMVFNYCQAYLRLLETSIVLVNNSKAEDVKSWISSNSGPAVLEWNE